MYNKKSKRKLNQKGIGLVEVILALGLAVVVITSLVSLSIFTLRTSLQSKLSLEGTKIANRELELVRALRDSLTSWKTGSVASPGFVDYIDGTANDSGLPCDSAHPCHMDFTSGGAGSPIVPASGICNQTVTNTNSTACNATGQDVVHRSFYVTQISADVMRVNVSVTWNVGSAAKGTYVYTDLTNWK